MKKIILLSILVIQGFVVFSWNDKDILTLDRYKNLYDLLETAQLEMGVTPKTAAYPLTLGEVKDILETVKNSSLYEVISEEFRENNLFSLNLSSELYWGVQDLTRSESPLEIGVYPYLGDFFSAYINVPVRYAVDITAEDIPFSSNLGIFANYEMLDIQFPFVAVSSIGGELWNLSLGRDLLSYGDGKTGNFIISDASTYHDFLRIKGFGKYFNYNFTVINIEALDGIGDLDPSFSELENPDDTTPDREDLKILFSHYLEFRPLKNLRIALNETLVRGDTPITLSVINPLMIMHNVAVTDVYENNGLLYGNSILTYEINYTPIKSLGLYGQFVQDQYETASEVERMGGAGKGEPNAYGYLLGVNYTLPVDKSIHLTFNGEYGYTNPHLYRSPNTLNLYANTWYHHSVYNKVTTVMVEPLGYEYGPDARVVKLSLLGRLLDYKLNVGLDYIYLEKGEKTLEDKAESGAEAVALSTPTGDAQISHIFMTDISYNINRDLSLYFRSKNLEMIIGCSYKL